VAAKKADKLAKVTEKKRKEDEAEAAKDTLAEVEIDESFIQRQEQQSCIHQQSDMCADSAGKSDDPDDGDDPEKFENLMDMDFSGDSDMSEADGERCELKTPTKEQGAPALTAAMVSFQ
jgi:hypothetical protein